MNPEVKKLWLQALRSGEYTQGTGVLRTRNDEYCCLGVLCEIAAQQGVIPPPTQQRGGFTTPRAYFYDEASHYLSPRVMEWAGLSSQTGIRPESLGVSLAVLNDDGSSFKEIADIIEAEF